MTTTLLIQAEKASFAPICPDFVIELCSANDTLNGLTTKIRNLWKMAY